ncbi:ATP-dependent helicase HRQ1 [Linum grandiflorum]
MAQEEQMKIEVRALTGESIVVSVSRNKTVDDLKRLLLFLDFSPAAATSPSLNFHLFFKGVKLSLNGSLSTLAIRDGEFLVLIPFVKKDKKPAEKPTSLMPDRRSSISSFADAAYSDMIKDLSSMVSESSKVSEEECDGAFSGIKRKRNPETDGGKIEEGLVYDFLSNVLRSPNKNIVDGENCEKFVEVLESMSCLTVVHSGMCMLLAASGDVGRVGRDDGVSCLCPVWLKRVMQAFGFLNVYGSFLSVQSEEITSSCLEEALMQLSKVGFKVCFEDVKHLSVLCPKVIILAAGDTMRDDSALALIVMNSDREHRNEIGKDHGNGRKTISLSSMLTALRKRESLFKTYVCEAIRTLMGKSGNVLEIMFSLDDLLTFLKEGGIPWSGDHKKSTQKCRTSSSSSRSRLKRCCETNQLLPIEMVQHLQKGMGANGQIVHVEQIRARKAQYVDIPAELSNATKSVLKCMGINKLYSHQAESIMASLKGKNVVVATMTSSGKSLCYNVPVVEVLSKDLLSCALYLFPTKALAQDQLRALLTMTKAFDTSINIGVYDGDTCKSDRMLLRSDARLLITNPDMLHMSILPHHEQFSRILANLRFVIIDEAHTYKGAFGCHTSLILRRLRRLCSHVYGTDPSFIFSTATSANPREHCMELANLSTLELIQNDGSPSAEKLFVLWNPSSLRYVQNDCETGMDINGFANKSLSPIITVSYLFSEMVQHGLRCIAFCKSRKLTELVLSYTHEILQETAPNLIDQISAYRAGYIPEERRKIERDFFSGKLSGIAATNALELGIDVGHIDATLHLGFPGSIASLWQQAGRSGRREKASIAVYVAFEGPLDQYFMKCPRKLFDSPIECCHVDSQNVQVVEQHLTCAAFEHPLSLQYDENHFGPGLDAAVMSLRNKGFVTCNRTDDHSARIWSYIGKKKSPSRGVGIRAIENIRYKVIDTQQNKLLEEIEESKAFFQVYEGAIYLHQGKSYLVKELDISEKVAWCQLAHVDYYTKTRDYTDVHVMGGDAAYPVRAHNQSKRTTAQARSCKVTTTWFGFRRVARGSNKVIDTVDLSLPSYSYESQAAWIGVPQSLKKSVEDCGFSFRDGLHAASHALLNVVPL